MRTRNSGEKIPFKHLGNLFSLQFPHRIWDYPVKEQYASILMSIDNAEPLPNASEGFRIVSETETNDFAFIHDANEIKYEITRFVLFLRKIEYFSDVFFILISQKDLISLQSLSSNKLTVFMSIHV